jgi:simple sugar transport system permease protein
MKNYRRRYKIIEQDHCTLAKRIVVLAALLLICLGLHSLIMLTMTDKPFEAYATLAKSAFSNTYQIVQTLLRSLPIMLVGLGVSLCLRAGILNLGGNGCVVAGAIGACIIGLNYEALPAAVAVPLTVIAAMVFGGLWSAVAGFLRAKFRISEIYVTVMLNYVMTYFASFLLTNVWKSQLNLDYSDQIFTNSHWPAVLSGTDLHLGFVFLVLAFLVVVFINRSPMGYEIRAHGLNSSAFRFKMKDHDSMRIVMFVMIFSGALAGLAGASQVCGHQYRFSSDVNNDFGFTGIIAAKLGGLNPVAIVVASLFLGMMESGSTAMQLLTACRIRWWTYCRVCCWWRRSSPTG